MLSSFKSLIVAVSIFATILLAGCGNDPIENTSGSSIILAELGEPYVQIATETHRQNNCDGSDQGLKIARNLQLEQNVNYYVETGITGLIEGEVPAVLKAQIQAAIDSGVSQSWGEYSSRGVEFTVKIDPGKVAEHTIAWKETKVDGIVEIRATAGIGRVRFIKTVAVELENRTSTERTCDEVKEPLPVSCTVPNLVGVEQSAAQFSIQQLGLNATISTQYSEDASLGIVLSQSPSPQTELSPCQGSIGILVSLGSVLTPTPTIPNTPVPPTTTPVLPTSIPPTTIASQNQGPIREHYQTVIGDGLFSEATFSDGLAPYSNEWLGENNHYKIQIIRLEEQPDGCDAAKYDSELIWISAGTNTYITINGEYVGTYTSPGDRHGYVFKWPIRLGDRICAVNTTGFHIVIGPDIYYHYDSYCYRGNC